MEFLTPALIFGILILLVLFVYFAFNFLIFYHLVRFGVGTQPKAISALFIAGSIILFVMSVFFMLFVDFAALQTQFSGMLTNIFSGNYL